MAIKQIYVSKGAESFWERAERKAKGQGVSLSAYLSRLVRNDIIGNSLEKPIDVVAQEAVSAVLALAHKAVPDDAL